MSGKKFRKNTIAISLAFSVTLPVQAEITGIGSVYYDDFGSLHVGNGNEFTYINFKNEHINISNKQDFQVNSNATAVITDSRISGHELINQGNISVEDSWIYFDTYFGAGRALFTNSTLVFRKILVDESQGMGTAPIFIQGGSLTADEILLRSELRAKNSPFIMIDADADADIGILSYKSAGCIECAPNVTDISGTVWLGGRDTSTPSDINVHIGEIKMGVSGTTNSNLWLVSNVASLNLDAVLRDEFSPERPETDKFNLNIKNGTTTLTPEGTNTYSGYTVIQGGTLRAGSSGAFSGNSDFYMTQHGVLDLNGTDQTIGSFSSAGTTYFNQKGDSAGTTLTVNGDYHGSGGTLVFNTVLGGDNSATDFLHILGDADGGTNVKVNNLGGQGAQTVEGIKLITVDGNIAGDTEFRQSGRIVAGAYDYRLVQGGNGGEHNSWYLTSGVQPPVVEPGPEPVPPVAPGPEPVDPITPVDPELPEVPEPPVMPDLNTVRPEGGSYLSNLAATEMFFTRLEDRNGVHTYTDVITGEKKQTSMWLRAEGHHIDSKDSSGQLDTRENRYTLQLGGDVAKGTFSGTDSWRLGLMAGYGNSHSNTRSDLTGYQSKGDADGYTVGMYGTWYADAERRTGTWVDTWLQYAWFNNSVQGEGLEKEKYDSKGLQASVETGYTLRFAKNKNTDYLLEPQAQVIWNGVTMDDHREANGTKVSGKGENNIHTRLGVRGGVELGDGTGATWTPYVAVNWHHNTQEYGVQMDDVSLSASGAKNIAEVKAGVEGQLTRELSVRGGISAQAGSDDYRSLGGMLGVSYSF